jgi:hypothetical protein
VEERSAIMPLLVPAMCLNRYYVAEGVRVYSQASWKLLMGDTGRRVVADLIEHVVPYYISQSKVCLSHEAFICDVCVQLRTCIPCVLLCKERFTKDVLVPHLS